MKALLIVPAFLMGMCAAQAHDVPSFWSDARFSCSSTLSGATTEREKVIKTDGGRGFAASGKITVPAGEWAGKWNVTAKFRAHGVRFSGGDDKQLSEFSFGPAHCTVGQDTTVIRGCAQKKFEFSCGQVCHKADNGIQICGSFSASVKKTGPPKRLVRQ